MAMTVELAEVAAGLPMAASLALAGGITSLREGRRRAALNEAMHELRRPLQVLSLSLPAGAPEAAPAESSLQLATVALERLDREINGAPLEEGVTVVSVRELIGAAAQRWRQVALHRGGSLEVHLNGGDSYVDGDRFDLAQALDNLLSNAVEHGGRKVKVQSRREGGWVRISVIDDGILQRPNAMRRRLPRGGRCRRGHGLRLVGRIARSHGGSFAIRRTEQGTEACLRLPLRRQVGEG